jgi:hypothetical protein
VTALDRGVDTLLQFWHGDALGSFELQDLSAPLRIEQLWTADLDGDGLDELVVYGDGLLSVIHADNCIQVIANPPQLDALALGDADGDGADELAYADSTGLYVVDLTPSG